MRLRVGGEGEHRTLRARNRWERRTLMTRSSMVSATARLISRQSSTPSDMASKSAEISVSGNRYETIGSAPSFVLMNSMKAVHSSSAKEWTIEFFFMCSPWVRMGG